MKSFNEGVALLNAQDKIIESAEAEKKRIMASMTAQFCPIKLDDVVEVNAGYAHKGKRMRVTKVWLKTSWGGKAIGFGARGKVLKKNGTVGLNDGEHFSKPVEDGA